MSFSPLAQPELWDLKLEPWELNLSELQDGGASILDLPDGNALAPLLVNIHPYPGGTAYPRVIMGSSGDLGASIYRRTDASPALVLDARRSSVEAHLCRWLGWRLYGFVMGGPLTFEREDYHGTRSRRAGGYGWCLMAGSHPVGIWPVQSSPVAGIDDRTAALVALVKHYAADTAGQAPGADARHP